MNDSFTIKKIKDKIDKEEGQLRKSIIEVERIWEDTGLEPKDPTYLVEKTMRFEMAQENITKVFSLLNETINDYKKLCSELEKTDDDNSES
ncbi:MAG: hypothetical protein D4R90_05315 [Nitrosopumilales archaeon]|nr:MAG: hypothetical protein D4R90_05315 [Nitrosopumilales archaeon]